MIIEKSKFILVNKMNNKFKNLIGNCHQINLVQEYVMRNKLIKNSWETIKIINRENWIIFYYNNKKLKINLQLIHLEVYICKIKIIIFEVIKVYNNSSKLNKKPIIIIKINYNKAPLTIKYNNKYNKKF